MRKKLVLVFVITFLIVGCQSIENGAAPIDDSIFSVEESCDAYGEYLSFANYDEPQEAEFLESCATDEYLEDSEIMAFIREIVATEPLELSESELRHFTERYVYRAHFFAIFAIYWESASQLNAEWLLEGYERFEFNIHARTSDNLGLDSLVVDEYIVEAFITNVVDIDIEKLRQTSFYEAESSGYRFRFIDGLGGGIFHPYANRVWKSEPFIVIEIHEHERIGDGVSYALIEIIDEERFMYRAYVQLP